MIWTQPHSTHVMEERVDIRCPGSTPRFYTVRRCTACEMEEMQGIAGRFPNPDLALRCEMVPPEPSVQESINRLYAEIRARKDEIRTLRKL